MTVSIIIPAYNEEGSIGTTIERIKESVPDGRIIVVDDGSTDKTKEIAKKLKVEVITHDVNMGYGAALKTGLKRAGTEYLAFLDADLTYDPKYIPLFLDCAKKEGLDCVWGDRFGGEVNKMPFLRKIGNRLLVLAFVIITLRKIHDCTCGERLLTGNALKKLDLDTLPNDLDFITALTKRIVARKLRYEELPIDYEQRSGSSKLNSLKHGYKMLKNILVEK